MVKSTVFYDFEVRHHEYGTVVVSSIGPDSATVTAARRWGVAEEWGSMAAYCNVRKLGKSAKAKCRRCGTEIEKDGVCQSCARAEEEYRRQVAARGNRDRRAGYRERT